MRKTASRDETAFRRGSAVSSLPEDFGTAEGRKA
jgi:hypothetical protein